MTHSAASLHCACDVLVPQSSWRHGERQWLEKVIGALGFSGFSSCKLSSCFGSWVSMHWNLHQLCWFYLINIDNLGTMWLDHNTGCLICRSIFHVFLNKNLNISSLSTQKDSCSSMSRSVGIANFSTATSPKVLTSWDWRIWLVVFIVGSVPCPPVPLSILMLCALVSHNIVQCERGPMRVLKSWNILRH